MVEGCHCFFIKKTCFLQEQGCHCCVLRTRVDQVSESTQFIQILRSNQRILFSKNNNLSKIRNFAGKFNLKIPKVRCENEEKLPREKQGKKKKNGLRRWSVMGRSMGLQP